MWNLTSWFFKNVEEFGQQSRNLDCENRRLKLKIEILENRNNVYECKIVLYYFLVSKDNIDQAISVFLSNRSSYLSGSK